MNAAFFCLECEQNHMVISSVSSSPGTNGSMRVITLLCIMEGRVVVKE